MNHALHSVAVMQMQIIEMLSLVYVFMHIFQIEHHVKIYDLLMTMASWFHSCGRADEKEHTNAHTH